MKHSCTSAIIRRSRAAALLLALLSYSIANAASDTPQPQDFAWQWPLAISADDDALRIDLTADVYAQLARDDLRDIMAFNGAGESMPLGPLPGTAARSEKMTPANVELPLFAVPRPVAAGGDRLALLIERDADGRLRRLDTGIDSTPASSAGTDWLLDLSSVDGPVRGLLLLPRADAIDGLNARVEVSGSRDLDRWELLGPSQAVLSLREGELLLQRLTLTFPAARWPYLRLRRSDADAELPLAGALALPMPASVTVDQRAVLALDGEAVRGEPGVFVYRLPGPYPIDRVGVLPADRNALAAVRIDSRSDAEQGWRQRAHGAAFRLASGGEDVSADPFAVGPGRDRLWRLRSEPPLARPPTLQFGYPREAMLLLAQGDGPFRLVAGSARAQRPDYPLSSVLAVLRTQHGDAWQPRALPLDGGELLAGDDARIVAPQPSYRQWLLWGLLAAAAAVIIVLVLRLLRESKAA